MNRNRMSLLLATALVGSVALVGCKKKEEAVVPPPAAETPAPAPQAPAPAAATASVTTVDLGSAVDATSNKVTTAATTFKPTDKIFASITTVTSDPSASVPGKLGAKWSFQDGQVVNDESRDVTLTGDGNTAFSIAKPDGWPEGKYKVEVSLDGNVVQTKEFEVKK